MEVTYYVGLKQTLWGMTIELAAIKSCGLRLYQRIGEHKIGDSSEMVQKTCDLRLYLANCWQVNVI